MTEKPSSRPDPQDLRDWAGDTIGVDVRQPAGDITTSLLRRLAEQDFAPPDSWHAAVDVLTLAVRPVATSLPLAYYHERHPALRDEIEQFAEAFFDLPLDQRLERWEDLSRRCAPWPALRRWLKRLRPGLDVECRFGDAVSASTATFGRLVCRTFLQFPGEAGGETAREVALLRSDMEKWKAVAKSFRKDYPTVTRLNQKLVDEFADHSPQRLRQAMQNLWPARTAGAEAEGDSDYSVGRFGTLVIVMFLMGILRSGCMLLRTNQEPTYRQSASIQIPQPTYNGSNAVIRMMEETEIQRIKGLGNRATPAERERLHQWETLEILSKAGVIKFVRQPRSVLKTPSTADRPPPPPLPIDATLEPAFVNPFLPNSASPDHE